MHQQCRAALDRTSNDTDVLAAGFGVSIDCRARPDIGQIDRVREQRLRRARPGIINEPLDFDVRTETLLEPAVALPCQAVCDESLYMRNVWKMANPNGHGLGHGRARSDDAH